MNSPTLVSDSDLSAGAASLGPASVSVVIPTYQDGGQLEELLHSVRQQDLGGDSVLHEILVVETEGCEATKRTCASHDALYRRVSRDCFDHAGTRSWAAGQTTGEYLVFLSQDVLLETSGALRSLLQSMLRDSAVAACFGRQIAPHHASSTMQLKREFSYSRTSAQRAPETSDLWHGEVLFSNAFGAYRRSALEEIGWFGQRQLMCEDVAAAVRLLAAGHSVQYSAEAVALHRHHESLRSELTRAFDIGASHSFLRGDLQFLPGTGGVGVRFLWFGLGRLATGGPSAIWQIPKFVAGAALRWISYSLGRKHRLLPRALVPWLSSHPWWWGRSMEYSTHS